MYWSTEDGKLNIYQTVIKIHSSERTVVVSRNFMSRLAARYNDEKHRNLPTNTDLV